MKRVVSESVKSAYSADDEGKNLSEAISPNTTIAQYTIVSKIGEGGMGEVWRARDPKLGRDEGNTKPLTVVLNWTAGLKK